MAGIQQQRPVDPQNIEEKEEIMENEVMVEIPAIPPAFGPETAQWIKDQVTARPWLHDQTDWEIKSSCGTRRCIAGWAGLLHEEEMKAEITQLMGRGKFEDVLDPGKRKTMLRLEAFSAVGQKTLGLNDDQASYLFWHAGNERAVEILDLIIEDRFTQEELYR